MSRTEDSFYQAPEAGVEAWAGENRQRSCTPEEDLLKEIWTSTSVALFIADSHRFLYVNPAFEALTGYTMDSLSPLHPRTLLAPAHDGIALQRIGPLPSPLEIKLLRKNGEERRVTLTTTAMKYGQFQDVVLGTLVDVTPHKQREEALNKDKMRYKAVLDFAPDMVILYDLEGTVIDVSPAGAKILGVTREQAIGLNGPRDLWSEEDRARFPEILAKTLRDGEYHCDIVGVHPDGRVWFAESNAKVARLEDETFVVVIVRDVTERRRLEESLRAALREKEILLREIHHRVKNNMQIILALLKLQVRNTEDAKVRAMFRESQNRILSMAMIHEKLYQSEGLLRINLNSYLKDLASEAFASFGESCEGISLRTDIEEIEIGLDTAIPCGLLAVEIISNALKYAFPADHKGGEIFIGLGTDGPNRFGLTISDNGVGLPEDIEIQRLDSLGLRLVSDLVEYQLKGEMSIKGGSGTSFYVHFEEKQH